VICLNCKLPCDEGAPFHSMFYAGVSDAVDIYNSATRQISTARLSVPRMLLAATSVGDLAIFAGGNAGVSFDPPSLSNVVDIFNSTSKMWTTAKLSMARYLLVAASVGNTAIFAGGALDPYAPVFSDVVDLFKFVSRVWYTAQLSVARSNLVAASVGNIAMFAGGAKKAGVFVLFCFVFVLFFEGEKPEPYLVFIASLSIVFVFCLRTCSACVWFYRLTCKS
jgi:hypothetical protein